MLTQKVYFDYDQDVLRDDARAVLDAKVPILLANPGVSVEITGHTDERGTSEYNLALGQRRAAPGEALPDEQGSAGRAPDRAEPRRLAARVGRELTSRPTSRIAAREFEPTGGGALVRPRS